METTLISGAERQEFPHQQEFIEQGKGKGGALSNSKKRKLESKNNFKAFEGEGKSPGLNEEPENCLRNNNGNSPFIPHELKTLLQLSNLSFVNQISKIYLPPMEL